MIVDTSALVAVILGEPDAEGHLRNDGGRGVPSGLGGKPD
ncbi:MAG: type II toxin-antitoxin system VapC family toxin [Propionibacteriaceae bacterium]|nr:type II toxin-antitoxin system VapC family toxin [Propionibacteriaceae bacterium]